MPDGEAALTSLRAAARPPRLLLPELNMPRLGGLDMLQALRVEGCVIQAVTFSSSDAEGNRQEALALGAVTHVVKPVSFDGFTRVILNVLHEYAPLPLDGRETPPDST